MIEKKVAYQGPEGHRFLWGTTMMRFWCWHLGKPAGFHPSQAPAGSAAVSSNTGSMKAGAQPPDRKWKGWNWVWVQEEWTRTGPHFLFLTCGTSFAIGTLKQEPAGAPVPVPWRLFLPGLVLSSALCCLDLRLQSWYKYCTFSWMRYRLETRTSKTEIKKKGAGSHSQHWGMTKVEKVSFDAAMSLRLPSTCPPDAENNCSLRQIARHRDFCCRQSVACLRAANPGRLEAMKRISSLVWAQISQEAATGASVSLSPHRLGPAVSSRAISNLRSGKRFYNSFLFRLSVWKLCGLEAGEILCGSLRCLGSAISKEIQPCVWFVSVSIRLMRWMMGRKTKRGFGLKPDEPHCFSKYAPNQVVLLHLLPPEMFFFFMFM